MKQKLAFTTLMGIVTTGLISFVLVGLNFGFRTGFLTAWFRSWIVSYPLAVAIILFIGPRVQALTNILLKKPAVKKHKHRIQDKSKPADSSSLQ